MRKLSKGRRDDRGAAAVEFALVLPVLVVLLFGMVQFGIAYDAQLKVTHAAREGARMAAVGGDVAAAVTAQTAGLQGVTLMPTVLFNDTTSGGRGKYCEVTVKCAYALDIPLWGNVPLNLRGTAQMRMEN